MKNPLTIGLVSLGVVIVCIVGIFLSTDQITNGHIGLLMLALIVVAIMLGFPTAFTLMGLRHDLRLLFVLQAGTADLRELHP